MYTIDLHGLFVDEAMTFLSERIEKVKKTGKNLTVITGAGLHSKNDPLIKTQVISYLKGKGYKYDEIKNGELEVKF